LQTARTVLEARRIAYSLAPIVSAALAEFMMIGVRDPRSPTVRDATPRSRLAVDFLCKGYPTLRGGAAVQDDLLLSSDSSSRADLQRCGYGRKAGFPLCWDLHPDKNSFRLCCEPLHESDKIVSVGGDHELLWLRNAVLQSAGFNV